MPRYLSQPSADVFPKSADVVIIGGGPAGTAALWALHRADPTVSVVLIESASQLASGSSTASLENFRTCWSTECIAQQMKFSTEVFLSPDEYLGEGASLDLHVKKRGYLFCGFNEAQAHTLRADVDVLHLQGIAHIEYLDAAALRERFAWLDHSVIAAKYDPIAGWLDSYGLVNRYAKSAESATILFDVQDSTPMIDAGKVTGVRTNHGTISTRHVILANGAYAGLTAKNAGLSVPIVVRPRQSFTTDFRHSSFPTDAPMLIGSAPFPHVRPEAGDSAIFGWEYGWKAKHGIDPKNANSRKDALLYPVENKDRLKDPRMPSIALMILAEQFGHSDDTGFADSRYLRGVRHNIGYYVYRDESAAYKTLADGSHVPYDSERAILDEHPDAQGLFLSIAHSGHGVMTSPAAGTIIAAKVLGYPLAHSLYAQFSLDTKWVAYDDNAL